jgi:acyl-CoA thioesterase-1
MRRFLTVLFYQVYPQLSQELDVPLVPFILEDVAPYPDLMLADDLRLNAQAQAMIANKIQAKLFPLLQ